SFSSRRRHTRFSRDWSSDVCSSDLSLTTIVHAQNLLTNPSFESFPAGTSYGEATFYNDGWRFFSVDGAGGSLQTLSPGYEGNIRSEERRVGKECRTRGEAQSANIES